MFKYIAVLLLAAVLWVAWWGINEAFYQTNSYSQLVQEKAHEIEPRLEAAAAAQLAEHTAQHLARYGHLFAIEPPVSEEELQHLRLHGGNEVFALERLMYAYWNNHLGVPVDLERAYYFALRAKELGSQRGYIATAVIDYHDPFDAKGRERALFYLSELERLNDTDLSLYERHSKDPFISQLTEFKTIFEDYKQSNFYDNR